MGEEASEAVVALWAGTCVAWHGIAYVNSGPQTPVMADEAIGRLFARRASRMKVAAGKFLGRLGGSECYQRHRDGVASLGG